MKELKNFEEFKQLIEEKETFILYSYLSECGVCDVFVPVVQELSEKYELLLYGASIDNLPELRGQLGVFTIPVLSVYFEGREYHKQARFINLDDVERRIQEIVSQ